MNNNPFNDKINKAVAEAARKVMEQSVAEAKEKEQEDRPDVPFAGPYRDATKPAKDKFGNVIKNRAKSLAKQGMAGVRKEEVEQIDESLRYTGSVNDKDYKVHVPRGKDLGDYSAKQLHTKIAKENPHLAHHEVKAIVDSEGAEESHVEVEHEGKKYKHHVYNEQEPRRMYEEVEQISEEYVIHKGKHEPGTKSSLGGQTLHGVTVKDVYKDKKEAQTHADKINAGRGYKPGDEKNSLYGGVLYQVSPAKSMKEEAEQIAEKAKWRSSSAAEPDSDHDWDRSPRSTGGMRATSDARGDTGGEYDHSSLENRRKAQVASKGPNAGKTTKASNASLKARIRTNIADLKNQKTYGANLPEDYEQMDWQTIYEAEEHVEIKNYPHLHDFVHGSGSANSGQTREEAGKIKVKRMHAEKAEEALKKAKQKGMNVHAAGASADEGEDTHEGHKIPRHALNILDRYMYEGFELMDESRRWNPDGSPKNVGLKAAKKFGKEQDRKTALHHFAKGAAKDDLSKFKKEETSHIAERLTGKQHKIDANKNGEVDAHDFKLLRSKTKKMMKENYVLMEDTTPALSSAMKAILADAFHMYFKAHTFHWNVEGANFPEYHKFFGDVYEQLFDTIDPIAEEIRALGEYAPRSLTELKGSTSIDDSSVQTPAEMFASLLGDNSKILAGLTNGYKVAEASGEIGLSNFLQDKIDAHKKLGWMIKSVSKGA